MRYAGGYGASSEHALLPRERNGKGREGSGGKEVGEEMGKMRRDGNGNDGSNGRS